MERSSPKLWESRFLPEIEPTNSCHIALKSAKHLQVAVCLNTEATRQNVMQFSSSFLQNKDKFTGLSENFLSHTSLHAFC